MRLFKQWDHDFGVRASTFLGNNRFLFTKIISKIAFVFVRSYFLTKLPNDMLPKSNNDALILL